MPGVSFYISDLLVSCRAHLYWQTISVGLELSYYSQVLDSPFEYINPQIYVPLM